MKKLILATAALTLLSAGAAQAGYGSSRTYEVTVTNITKGETFTPILGASHKRSIGLFELGEPASTELADLAESGNVAPLKNVLDGLPNLVRDTTVSPGLLGPGQSATFTIDSARRNANLSVAAMLIPTNDTFMALDTVRLPSWGSRTYYANAYDAGSETNDEICANIPGPQCGGTGPSPADEGEGFVHIASGIHGEAELLRSVYDWRGPVAQITVTRMY
jgi:hypothetical protein